MEQDDEDQLEQEVIAETQFDTSRRMDVDKTAPTKKGANKRTASAQKSSAKDDEDSSDMSPKERRLTKKIDLVSDRSTFCAGTENVADIAFMATQMTKALAEQQEAFKQLTELRYTKAEESERELISLSSERQEGRQAWPNCGESCVS